MQLRWPFVDYFSTRTVGKILCSGFFLIYVINWCVLLKTTVIVEIAYISLICFLMGLIASGVEGRVVEMFLKKFLDIKTLSFLLYGKIRGSKGLVCPGVATVYFFCTRAVSQAKKAVVCLI